MTTPSFDPTTATVTSLSVAIASGQVTPADVLEGYLSRIEALEPLVQAWSYLDVADVRRQAAVLTEEAKAGRLRSPMHGIPVGVKDELHVAGTPTGMAGDKGPRPEDATAVARLRAAGAVIMGKTHMPIDGVNPPTRNPWNLAHTAGGTSSGSGAAVGARMVPFALGEQTYGSNLRPAAFNGVAGLKPTFGRIGRWGVYQFSYSHDHVGLIGLTMEDLALAFSLMAGPDPRDPSSRPEPAPPAHLGTEGVRPPRIGLVRNFFPERTGPVVQQAVEASALRLKEAGADVVDIRLPDDFDMVWKVHLLVGGPEGYAFRSAKAVADGVLPPSRDVVAAALPAGYYLQAQRVRRILWRKLQDVTAQVDALLMAVAPTPAPEGTGSTGDPGLLVPWSCLGYPAITVNGGQTPERLPIGLQLVAGPMADHRLMQVGAWCEDALGRLPCPDVKG